MRWVEVTTGRSGARVFRGPGVYRKESADTSVDLRDEGERLTWLRAQGVPAPEVLEVDRGLLTTVEVPGRTAAELWDEGARPQVVDALARLASVLHALAVETCPFDRRLDAVLPQALRADVDLDDLDPERHGWTRERLVAELVARRPVGQDLVVCHGDLSLPNVVLDPTSLEVVGVVDVGRLGVADRWSDLALATRSLASQQNPQYGDWAASRFLQTYGVEPDVAKADYYRLLDEFF